jgi:methionyl-tRNA formyltransferase
MRVAVLCATQRGIAFVKRLHALLQAEDPATRLDVFSFREDDGEPLFFEPLKQFTESVGGAFFEARQVSAPRLEAYWRDTPPDLMFMVSWRYLVPPAIYERARLGAYVFHDSLLPAYRGFAPTVWAIINGENHTGVTLFEAASRFDAGAIIAQRRVPIGPDDTIADVLPRVTDGYLTVLAEQLPALLSGHVPRTAQDESLATYTCRRLREDNQIDWARPAAEIYNLVRAVTAPYPGAFTTLEGQRLFVWAAQLLPDYPRYTGVVAGRVVEVLPGTGSIVLTGDGALLLTTVQREGGPAQNASAILNRLSHTLGR